MPQRYACGPMGLELNDPHYFETARSLRPPQGWRALDRDDVQRLHELYYDPAVELPEISRRFGVATSTLLRWIAEMGWPSRRALKRGSCAALRQHGADLRSDPAAWDGKRMRESVAGAVQRESAFVLDALESGAGGPQDHVHRARALALLTRAMLDLRKLEEMGAGRDAAYQEQWQRDPHERPPRSLDELREELARKVQRIFDEEEAARVDGDDE